MATAVQLIINVDTEQGIAEINKFSTAMTSGFSRAQAALAQFGSSTSSGTAAMTRFVGVVPTANAAVEDHAKVLERARIAGQTFANMMGFVLPRGLDQFISKSRAIAPILNGAFSVLVTGTLVSAVANFAARGVQALITLSEEAEREREAWIDINSTVRDSTVKILTELDQQKQKYWNRLLRIRDNDNGYSLDLVPIGETEDRCCHRMGHQLEKAIALLIGDAEVEITAADVASAQAACVDLFVKTNGNGECELRLQPQFEGC